MSAMKEQVWEQRGIGRPLDRIVGSFAVRIPRRTVILAIASILVVVLLHPAPVSAPISSGSVSNVASASTVTVGPSLTLHIPVGVRVDACASCYVGPYLFRSYVPYPARFGTRNCEPPWLIGFASTAATPSVVRARIDAFEHSTGAVPTSQITIGGSAFTVLDYGLTDCGPAIAIGNVDDVTYLIDMRMGPTNPTVAVVLRSISFFNLFASRQRRGPG